MKVVKFRRNNKVRVFDPLSCPWQYIEDTIQPMHTKVSRECHTPAPTSKPKSKTSPRKKTKV